MAMWLNELTQSKDPRVRLQTQLNRLRPKKSENADADADADVGQQKNRLQGHQGQKIVRPSKTRKPLPPIAPSDVGSCGAEEKFLDINFGS